VPPEKKIYNGHSFKMSVIYVLFKAVKRDIIVRLSLHSEKLKSNGPKLAFKKPRKIIQEYITSSSVN